MRKIKKYILRKLIAFKYYLKRRYEMFLESRKTLAITVLTIGIIWTSNFYEIKEFVPVFEPVVIVNTVNAHQISTGNDAQDSFESKKVQTEVEEVKTSHSANLSVVDMIKNEFGKDADMMIDIAMCESGLDPAKVGDEHLTAVHNGELLGSSHGLFQVRTGEAREGHAYWNRAAANDMSVDEFIAWMHEPKANIEYAKDIFEGRGASAWFNCAKKLGYL